MWEEKERRIKEFKTRPKYICSNCGETCREFQEEDMSGVGCLMWIVFFFISMGLGIIIFIIYKLLHKSNKNICPNCKAENCLIPIDSPKGQQLFEQYYEIND